jgi:SAM-dependent methyltransferase
MFDYPRKIISSYLSLADTLPGILLSRLGFDRRASYLFEQERGIIERIENDPQVTTRAAALRRLRELGLDDFAFILWFMPNPAFPKLSRLLPAMASAQTQRHWTGRSGIALLKPSVNFVRTVAYHYGRLSGAILNETSTILDYGCGYGRIARLMYYFADEAALMGVDPWDKSIAMCQQAGLGANFKQSDYLPRTLPVGETKFNLIYAYSVFTHLSEAASVAALSALRHCIKDGGVLALTLRPVEYWQLARYIRPATATAKIAQHHARGFAFHPLQQNDEHALYGDTSIALSWLEQHCPDWAIRAVDRSLSDRLQTYVFLTPE